MNPLKASFLWLVAGEKVTEIQRMRTQELSGGLVVRRLASTVGSKSWIHGQGTKIIHASWPKKEKKKKALGKEQHTIASFEDGRGHMARNAGGLSQEADSSPWLTASK